MSPVSSNYSGDAGLAKMREEQDKSEAHREARRAQMGMPFRFFCAVGESREVVVADDRPDFFRYEHNLQDPRSKRWDVYVPCIDEHCNCPACIKDPSRPAYFGMFLTVIDLTPYVKDDGTEIPFTKKLLVVKPMQQKKIMRYFERHGTLRGMILSMTRDSKKDAGIGDPEFVEFMTEEDMQTYVTDYTDKDGVVHEIFCDEPYDYMALYPAMDEAQLRAIVGGDLPSGSRGADDRALGRGRAAPAREDAGDAWGGQQPRRVATRRGAAAEPPETVEYDDVDPEPAPPPARRAVPARTAPAAAAPARQPARQAAPAAPARVARVARAAPAIDPDDSPDAGYDPDEPPFEPDPPQRTSRAAPARLPAPEPEVATPAPNVATRRAQLRGRG